MKFTLAKRMTAMVAATVFLSLLSIVWFSSYSIHKMSRELTHVRMQKTADLIRFALTDSILSNDLAKIDSVTEEILNSDYGILRMCVFNQTGLRLSQCRCNQIDDRNIPGTSIVESLVMIDSKAVGNVGVAYDHNQKYPDIEKIESIMFYISTTFFFLTVGFVYYVSWVFEKEVGAMESALGQMSDLRTSQPLRSTPFIELDRISKAFNKLIEKQDL